MKETILGVRWDNLSFDRAVDRTTALLDAQGAHTVYFLNIDCLRIAQHQSDYLNALLRADLVLSDGIGFSIAVRLFGSRMRANCNGTEMSPELMSAAAEKGRSVFFLGARPGIAEAAARAFEKRIPGLRVAGAEHGYFQDDEEMIRKINASGADVLFVAMGAPRQELWIDRHRARLKPRLCLGIGALFDYASGRVRRAPAWMIRLKLEWLWRVGVEPARLFRRYFIDGFFFMAWLIAYRFFGGRKRTASQAGSE